MPLFNRKPAPAGPPREMDDVPQTPQSDSLDLVPVSAVVSPFLLRNDGAFICMLEIPSLDKGISGENVAVWSAYYQKALESLPPGTKFQLSVLMDPVDPRPDINFFIDKMQYWNNESANPELSDRKRQSAATLMTSGAYMSAEISDWYERYRPCKTRMIITLTWTPPFETVKSVFGKSKASDIRVSESRQRLPEAISKLGDQVSLFQTAFGNAGLPLTLLSPGEMCQAIWLSLHPVASDDPALSYSDLATKLANGEPASVKEPPPADVFTDDLSVESLASLLAPDNVIERKDDIEVDGVMTSGIVISDYQANRPVFMSHLSALQGGWFGSMFIEVSDPVVMSEALRQKEVQKYSGQMLREKQGRLPNFGEAAVGNQIQKERADIEMRGVTPILIRFFAMKSGYNRADMNEKMKGLTDYLKTVGAYSYIPTYNQVKLWRSVVPVGWQALDQKERNMSAAALSTFFWPGSVRFDEPHGVHLGFDMETKLPVRVDPFGFRGEKTPIYLAIGKPGAGKSVWLRSTIVSTLLSGGSVIALDIENEMRGLCEMYGGRYIDVGTSTGERINVLDIPPDSDNPLVSGTEQFIRFFSSVAGHPIQHSQEWNLLSESYQLVMKDRDWLVSDQSDPPVWSLDLNKWSVEDAPRLHDVYRVLRQHSDPLAQSLADAIHPYSDGLYAPYFNTSTTFDIRDEKLVIFGLKNVSQEKDDAQTQVYMWSVLNLIWGEIMRRNHAYPSMTNHIVLDEVWKLMLLPGGGESIENMARRFRKRRACLWMATQTIGEFLDSKTGQNIIGIAENVFLMKQEIAEASRILAKLQLPQVIGENIPKLPTGEGILKSSNGLVRLTIEIPQEWGVI